MLLVLHQTINILRKKFFDACFSSSLVALSHTHCQICQFYLSIEGYVFQTETPRFRVVNICMSILFQVQRGRLPGDDRLVIAIAAVLAASQEFMRRKKVPIE